MSKRQTQLNEYLSEQHDSTHYNIDSVKSRINQINTEIRRLDDERFLLTYKLFNLQNKQIEENGNE